MKQLTPKTQNLKPARSAAAEAVGYYAIVTRHYFVRRMVMSPSNQRKLTRTQLIAIIVASASCSLAVIMGLRGQTSSAMMLVTCGYAPVIVAFRGARKET